MKPPVVHQPVQPPAGASETSPQDKAARPDTSSQGLTGSYGPIVDGRDAADRDGAGADERRKP